MDIDEKKKKQKEYKRKFSLNFIDQDSIDLINNTRRWHNMEPIRTGERTCLKCDKLFFSRNVKINKMCPSCKESSRQYA